MGDGFGERKVLGVNDEFDLPFGREDDGGWEP